MAVKMESTFYVNRNGTLANPHLWFAPTLDTSKLLFLRGILSGYLKPKFVESKTYVDRTDVSMHPVYIYIYINIYIYVCVHFRVYLVG